MKAVWYESTGAADSVLVMGDMPEPSPASGEVLVRVCASGVNPSDVKARAGARGGKSPMPYPRVVPHSDGAGVIEAVGAGVDPARVGERVWLWNGQWERAHGTAAQYIALPSAQAVHLDAKVGYRVGAALGIPAMTACHNVLGYGPNSGKTLLISGGAGTVGHLMLQFAKRGGAHVITTVGSEEDVPRARNAGADAVLKYDDADLVDRVLAANQGRPVDRIIEVEFGANLEANAELIARRGKLIAYGSARLQRPEFPFYPLMFKGVCLELVLVYLLTPDERRQAAERINRALADGLEVPIHRSFALDQCVQAHQAVEQGHRVGAVVLDID
jgi:NADPH2:quinone reductase